MRNPGRTATTAAALMVGLGLVVFVAVFANGLKASFTRRSTSVVTSDLIIRRARLQPAPGRSRGRGRARRRRSRPRRASCSTRSTSTARSRAPHRRPERRRPVVVRVALPSRVAGRGRRPVLGRLRGDTALVEEQFAKAHERRRRRLLPDPDAHRRPRAAARARASTATRSCCRARSSRSALHRGLRDSRDPWIIFAAHARRRRPDDVRSDRLADALAAVPGRDGRVAGRVPQTFEDRSSTSSSTCSTRCSP